MTNTKPSIKSKKSLVGIVLVILLVLLAFVLPNLWSPINDLESNAKKEIYHVVGNSSYMYDVTVRDCSMVDQGFIVTGRVCDYYLIVQQPGVPEKTLITKAEQAGWSIVPPNNISVAPGTIFLTKERALCNITVDGSYYPKVSTGPINYHGYEFDCKKKVI